ncbi:MAG: CocE/NonD family hydrolase [bacterium]
MVRIYLITFLLISYFCSGELWTEIEIPVRDGNYLKADFYSTDTTFAKPCILIQTPYNKSLYRSLSYFPLDSLYSSALFDLRNYNYVIMDWRGFYANKSAAKAQYDRGLDGYDAVEWIVQQNWSNGKIGTSGSSALGMIQFQTAKQHPSHLVCCAPFVKDYKTKYTDYFYGGVLRREHTEQLEKLGFLTVETITNNPIYNTFWKLVENQNDYPVEFEVPMFMCSGWFDHYPSDCIRAFQDIKTRSHGTVRDKHKFLMGPWTHSGLGVSKQGELEFPEAVNIPAQMSKDFFDYYLRDIQNGWELKPVINYFQMGENTWKISHDWYSVTSNYDTLYLWKGNSLREEPPPPIMSPMATLPDTIIYNPKDPSPSIGGSRFSPEDIFSGEHNTPVGPYDISDTVENRNDILIYSTDVLEKPIQIVGKIKIELFVKSDRKDTDFSVRLCDVFPDGKSYILTQGIKRARFRDNLEIEKFMEQDSIYKITIELEELAITFIEGHRLRIDITSSNYPMFDINPNTGGEMYKPDDTLTATNLILSNEEYSSKVIFPIPTATDVIKENFTNQIKVYPNPAQDYLNIYFENTFSQNFTIRIFNVMGEESTVLSNLTIEGNILRIPVNQLNTGVYFLSVVTTDRTREMKKMVTKFSVIR